jgi:hypothetical protein
MPVERKHGSIEQVLAQGDGAEIITLGRSGSDWDQPSIC